MLRICLDATLRLLMSICEKLKFLGALNSGTSVLNLDGIQHEWVIYP